MRRGLSGCAGEGKPAARILLREIVELELLHIAAERDVVSAMIPVGT